MCPLQEDATVKCWGSNYYGQLGKGDTRDTLGTEFVELPAVDLGPGRTAVLVNTGVTHMCTLLVRGRLLQKLLRC